MHFGHDMDIATRLFLGNAFQLRRYVSGLQRPRLLFKALDIDFATSAIARQRIQCYDSELQRV